MSEISDHIPKNEDTNELEEECGCSSISSDVSIVSSADLNGGQCRCTGCPGAVSLHNLSADFEGDAADITHKKCSIIKLIRSQNQEVLEGQKYSNGSLSMEHQSAALDNRLPERSAQSESELIAWPAAVDDQLPERSARLESELIEWPAAVDDTLPERSARSESQLIAWPAAVNDRLPERSTRSESHLIAVQSPERYARSESRLIEESALVEKQLRGNPGTTDGRLPERPDLRSTIERSAQLIIQAAESNSRLTNILLLLPQVLGHQGLGIVIALFTILALLLIGIVIGAGSHSFSYGQINSPLISCLAWYIGQGSNSENYYSVF